MSTYVEEVLKELREQLEEGEPEVTVEFVKKKLSTSWRNGYKAGYQDGKTGQPDKTLREKDSEAAEPSQ